MKEIVIDAKNQKLGRVASKAAWALRGKSEAEFSYQQLPPIEVRIINADQLDLDSRKLKSKIYKRYSGYPGGLKEVPLEKLISRHGVAEAMKLAVWGMLPKNKLRPRMIKHLNISA